MPAALRDSMRTHGSEMAIAGRWGECTYEELLDRVEQWRTTTLSSLPRGAIVAFDGDYGPGAISLVLALALDGHVLVPLSRDVAAHHESFMALAEAEYWVTAVESAPELRVTGRSASHELYQKLRALDTPGLVLFSSGSTGAHKAAVHDFSRLLRKFAVPRHCYRTVVFLQLDHIGGINTLLYTLANGGAAVVSPDRTPRAVCQVIAQYRAELLPTSPTFLNLLRLSEEYLRHDLSSLKLITYGTETMPEATLDWLVHTFPDVKLLQTYGLSELGILRSQSRGSDSLWVRVGGEGYETKVVDGRLWIRAHSAMMGYLNAADPFDIDGFFDTGDLVDVDGEWLRFRGRQSEIINVGGNKVFPAEVESVLLELPNVADVAVNGEKSPITGQVVTATVRLIEPETPEQFKQRMRQFCRGRLSQYKIPVRVRITEEPLYSARFKRHRQAS